MVKELFFYINYFRTLMSHPSKLHLNIFVFEFYQQNNAQFNLKTVYVIEALPRKKINLKTKIAKKQSDFSLFLVCSKNHLRYKVAYSR